MTCTHATTPQRNNSDHLEGVETYGDSNGGDHPNASPWSVRFAEESFDQFLFATGDGTKWMVMPRSELDARPTSALALSMATNPKAAKRPRLVDVLRSSVNPSPHHVLQMHRPTHHAEPWVTLRDHEASKKNDGDGFLYGGSNFHLAPASAVAPEKPAAEGYDNTVLPQEFGLRSVKHGGGANVYVRHSRQSAKLALCLRNLAVAAAAGARKDGSSSSSSSSSTEDQSSKVKKKMKKKTKETVPELAAQAALAVHPSELEVLGNDAGLRLLWRRAPGAVLLGTQHGFYRGEIVEWLSRELLVPQLLKQQLAQNSGFGATNSKALFLVGGEEEDQAMHFQPSAAAAVAEGGGGRAHTSSSSDSELTASSPPLVGLGAAALARAAGCECAVDQLWAKAACLSSVLTVLKDLTAGPVRKFLLDMALRGVLLGPLRRVSDKHTQG
jgi:hypothetical protein